MSLRSAAPEPGMEREKGMSMAERLRLIFRRMRGWFRRRGARVDARRSARAARFAGGPPRLEALEPRVLLNGDALQIVTATPDADGVDPGGTVTVEAAYTVEGPDGGGGDETLTGLGLRLHFDSEDLALDRLANVLANDLEGRDEAAREDSEDHDGDPATDKFVQVLWSDLDGQWPGAEATPVKLYDAQFVAAGGYDGTTLRFSAIETAPNHELSAPPVELGFATPLKVLSFRENDSGFRAVLNRDLDSDALNLFDGADAANDPADVRVTRDGEPVTGSLLWSRGDNTLRFVGDAGGLAAGDYVVRIPSRPDGVVDEAGAPLDGDAGLDGRQDFRADFQVVDFSGSTLSVPALVRGEGQAVDVPASEAGLPVSLDDGTGVETVSFELRFDPALLDVTDVVVGDALPASWRLNTIDLATAGEASVTLSGDEPLGPGGHELARFTGTVTGAAPKRDLLDVTAVTLNGGDLPGRGTDAVQQVGLLGDTDQDGRYTGLDASLVARAAVGIDTGFDAFARTAPGLVGDIDGDGRLTGFDASLVARQAVGLSVPEIPPLPGEPSAQPGVSPASSASMSARLLASASLWQPSPEDADEAGFVSSLQLRA